MRSISRISLLFSTVILLSCNQAGSGKNTNAAPEGEEKAIAGTGVPLHLTKSEFLTKVFNYEQSQEWKYQGDQPCIIDFYADWCRPCKMVAPIMDELAKEYNGKVRIYKINTDKERELAQAFRINSIPAVLFIPMEGQPQMSVGALPKEEYIKVINNLLLSTNQSKQQ